MISVRVRIEDRLAEPRETEVAPRLPHRLRGDDGPVRTELMRRLAASRLFAYGDRRGVLKAALNRSGRPFRLDVRQRVVVKALISKHVGKGAARGVALAKHAAYLVRAGSGRDGAAAGFFDAGSDAVDAPVRIAGWSEHRHHFRFIVSPEHSDRLHDLRDYVREVMRRVTADIGEPTLPWIAVCHFDTRHPHAHVLAPGRRSDGRDLVIPRDYIAYGLRARAQEVAQERLGDLSRQDAERRIWRETLADRFTGFDRRLLAARTPDGAVRDALGGADAWSALTRARLRHLEGLGLAERVGRHVRLADDLEERLRGLQRSRDIIRTLNHRQLETGRAVSVGRAGVLRGRIVSTGFHDEIGASGWMIVAPADGADQYVRWPVGKALPAVGRSVAVVIDQDGRSQLMGREDRARGLSS